MNWGFAEFVRLELLHARYKSKKCELIPPNIVDLPEFDPDFATRGWLQGADAAKKKRQLPETVRQPANLLTKGGGDDGKGCEPTCGALDKLSESQT